MGNFLSCGPFGHFCHLRKWRIAIPDYARMGIEFEGEINGAGVFKT